MTDKSEIKSKIEVGTIFGVASFCMSLVVAIVTFANATNDKFGEVERRMCRVEAAVKVGECGR